MTEIAAAANIIMNVSAAFITIGILTIFLFETEVSFKPLETYHHPNEGT